MELKKFRATSMDFELDLIEVKISEKMREFAQTLEFTPEDASESYKPELVSEAKGIPLGMLGETVYWKGIGFKHLHRVNLSSHDFVTIPDGRLVEVKTTIKKSRPEPHWALHLSESNRPRYQYPNGTAKDVYFFAVTIKEGLALGWLVGYIHAAAFFRLAKPYKKGYTKADGFVFKADTWELEYHELEPAKKFMPELFDYPIYPPCNTCNFYVFKGLDPFCKRDGAFIDERRWHDGCPDHIDRYAKVLPKQRG